MLLRNIIELRQNIRVVLTCPNLGKAGFVLKSLLLIKVR